MSPVCGPAESLAAGRERCKDAEQGARIWYLSGRYAASEGRWLHATGYFTELAAVEFMSRQMNVLASTVRIHDGDYWSHTLLRAGAILDRFATMPDYFTDEEHPRNANVSSPSGSRDALEARILNCLLVGVSPSRAKSNRTK